MFVAQICASIRLLIAEHNMIYSGIQCVMAIQMQYIPGEINLCFPVITSIKAQILLWNKIGKKFILNLFKG